MTPHFMHETVLQGQPPKPICEVTFFDMATGAQRLRAMAQVTQLINAGASYRGFFPHHSSYHRALESLSLGSEGWAWGSASSVLRGKRRVSILL